MSCTITIRRDGEVLRIEESERQALMSIRANALVRKDGLIVRAGLLPSDQQAVAEQREYDPALESIELRTPLSGETVDTRFLARLLHHVLYEFLQALRDRSDREQPWTLADRCEISLQLGLPVNVAGELAEELKKIPMFERCSIDGTTWFEKGVGNHPLVRGAIMIVGILATIFMIVFPLTLISSVTAENPTLARAALIALALAAAAGGAILLFRERKQGRASTMTMLFVAVVMMFFLAQMLRG
jgi:hypothetical protein